VLVARGTAASRLSGELPAGAGAVVRLITKPDWTGVVDAVGGGPVLVRQGRPVFRALEAFTTAQLLPRHPRTAIGQLADGRIVMVAVDGRQPGYSTGMTNFELAQTLARLGAVTGSALDAGGSTTMAFEGQLLNSPSDPDGERPVAEALLVMYAGVYAPLPLEPVLSPNGDAVADRQQLSYKVVRPSTVSVSLLGPDNVPRYTFSGQVAPGSYPFEWNGLKPDGQPDAEGRWHWVVNATDDLGRVSGIDRGFTVNSTLGFGKSIGPALGVPRANPRAVASFTLGRAATVTTRIETPSGVILKTLARQRAEPGQLEVAWDGRTGRGGFVYTGRYVAKAVAQNELGAVELSAEFSVRRVVRPAASG
jgi:hypothetical protein